MPVDGGWGVMDPPQMRGFIYNGMRWFLDGQAASYQFVLEMDGRLRGSLAYSSLSYPDGSTIPTRTWSASKDLDGKVTLNYSDELVTTDPLTGKKTTWRLTFDLTKPAAGPETFNAAFLLDSPGKFVQSIFKVSDGASSGNVVLEYAGDAMYFTGVGDIDEDGVDFDVDTSIQVGPNAFVDAWAREINDVFAGSAATTVVGDYGFGTVRFTQAEDMRVW